MERLDIIQKQTNTWRVCFAAGDHDDVSAVSPLAAFEQLQCYDENGFRLHYVVSGLSQRADSRYVKHEERFF